VAHALLAGRDGYAYFNLSRTEAFRPGERVVTAVRAARQHSNSASSNIHPWRQSRGAFQIPAAMNVENLDMGFGCLLKFCAAFLQNLRSCDGSRGLWGFSSKPETPKSKPELPRHAGGGSGASGAAMCPKCRRPLTVVPMSGQSILTSMVGYHYGIMVHESAAALTKPALLCQLPCGCSQGHRVQQVTLVRLHADQRELWSFSGSNHVVHPLQGTRSW